MASIVSSHEMARLFPHHAYDAENRMLRERSGLHIQVMDCNGKEIVIKFPLLNPELAGLETMPAITVDVAFIRSMEKRHYQEMNLPNKIRDVTDPKERKRLQEKLENLKGLKCKDAVLAPDWYTDKKSKSETCQQLPWIYIAIMITILALIVIIPCLMLLI